MKCTDIHLKMCVLNKHISSSVNVVRDVMGKPSDTDPSEPCVGVIGNPWIRNDMQTESFGRHTRLVFVAFNLYFYSL
jgi:hypothetical protein